MDEKYVMEKKQEEQYTVKTVVIDYETRSFMIYMQEYNPVEILFIEIEAFMLEFDEKLYEYLECKDTIKEKIAEGVDIGYDFGPMMAALLKSFIEYGLITPTKI